MVSKIEITPAPEAERIGNSLVERYHEHLEGVDLLYLLTTQAVRDGAQPAPAAVKRLSPKERFFLSGSTREGAEFALWFDRDQWNALTDPKDRAATVDHCLMHLQLEEQDEDDEQEGPAQLVIAGHDLHCFVDEVQRYGPWSGGLRMVARQLALWEDLEEHEGDTVPNEPDGYEGVESVTLSTANKSTTMSPEEFSRAARAAGRMAREQVGARG